MSADRALAHIERELQQIENLFIAYHELLGKASTSELNLVELTALAGVLHSFYNGVENVFQTVAKRVDKQMPSGADWHRELLHQMACKTDDRLPIVSPETLDRLEPYLGFRHFVRHAYSFWLDWEKMEDLVLELGEVWTAFQQDIKMWLNSESEGLVDPGPNSSTRKGGSDPA